MKVYVVLSSGDSKVVVYNNHDAALEHVHRIEAAGGKCTVVTAPLNTYCIVKPTGAAAGDRVWLSAIASGDVECVITHFMSEGEECKVARATIEQYSVGTYIKLAGYTKDGWRKTVTFIDKMVHVDSNEPIKEEVASADGKSATVVTYERVRDSE